MAAALNRLEYDAVGLGNHDFDHGLERLSDNLALLDIPVVCSNLSAELLPMVRPSLLIEKVIALRDGGSNSLKIGLLSTLPDKTAMWSRGRLENRATFIDPVDTLKRECTALRDQGADLIVVLAHMGLALFDEGSEAQNRVQEVAALDEVDVIIGGHTHLRFPGADHAGLSDINWRSGTVLGKPVVQPGPGGSDLAIIDLQLERRSSDHPWRIAATEVALRPVNAETPEAPDILSLAAPMHKRTRQYLDQDVARIERPMHSYFSLAAPSPLTALLAAAKRRVIEHALAKTEHAHLPLVASASFALTGGMDGPDNFLFLDAGTVKRRHVAGMNPFANNIWAVQANGGQLMDWLERAALIFNHLQPDHPDQPLVDTRIPGFRYDVIYGLEYSIDPSRPARFDGAGRRVSISEGRIRDLRWNGMPVDRDQIFVVATTDHRAGGGGHYPAFPDLDIVLRGQTQLQDAVLSYLQTPNCGEVRAPGPWRFSPDLQRQAILYSAPGAIAHIEEIEHLKPEPCGQTAEGFQRIRVTL